MASADPEAPSVPAAAGGEITHLLVAWSEGDLQALNDVFPLAFEDLRRIARKCHRQIPCQDLQPTELISEIYAVLHHQHDVHWESRSQFFAFAAQLMERVLLTYKRRLATRKRGGDAEKIALGELVDVASTGDASSMSAADPDAATGALEALSMGVDIAEKLAELAELDSLQADIVRLRYFAGLTAREVAETLGVCTKTVNRRWKNAKRFLVVQLGIYDDG